MNIETILGLENNLDVEGTFIISELNLRPFKDKDGFFLTFILQDKSGKINGKIWDNAEKIKKQLQDDDIISIRGKVNLYNSKNQVIVDQFKIPSNDEYNLDDLVVSSSKDSKEMFEELKSILDQIEDKDVLNLWNSFYQDNSFIEKFKVCPGGKGETHHAYNHGLLEHTLSVMKICEFFAQHYPDNVNKSVLLFGAFLHDIGKTVAYEYKLSIKMTDIGRLHGHVVTGYQIFLNHIEKVSMHSDKRLELVKVLGHMILSHHGVAEFEAVKVPMTQEASLLANADKIDSEVFHLDQIFSQVSDGWSQFDKMRDRLYYKSNKKEPDFTSPQNPEIKQKIVRRKPA